MTSSLDNFDRILLAAIQDDALAGQSTLGEYAGLSTAAVNRRLKIMRQTGVIEGYTARINPKAVGYGLTIIVDIQVANERVDLLDEMQRQFKACAQVQQCYYVAGECDFILILTVRDMEQYIALTRTLFQENGNIKAFKTRVAMDRIKTGMGVPIDLD